jgi:translocation and assembly module TamA
MFTKGIAAVSYYLQLFSKPRLVIASRVNIGVIGVLQKKELPPDIRFYAGGGGSVRGYGFQMAGSQENGIPLGGKSVAEGSIEARLRLSDAIGIVYFVDAGGAFRNILPEHGEKMYWGAGAGIRYYTGIGPFRLDIASPLARWKQYDKAYKMVFNNLKFYASIGQSF